MKLRKSTVLALVLAFASGATVVTAADPAPDSALSPQYGGGPGMMGGYGPGMMGGYGPGMRGGYGPGMMGGYGPGNGPGWVRRYAWSQLDLTREQQENIAQIQENSRERSWATMGQLRAEQFKLQSLYSVEKPDPDAVAEQQKKVDDLRRQLTKARVQAHNDMQAVLTKEQRERLRAYSPWWAEDANVGD